MIPGRHSLFWKLALLLCLSAVFTVVLSGWLLRTVGEQVVLLDEPAKVVMREYAAQAEDAWHRGGAEGVSAWLQQLRRREPGDAMVVDASDHSLSGRPLTESQRAGLRFQRELDWRMSFRSTSMPYIGVPFPENPEAGRLVMQLPPRFMPGRNWPLWQTLLVVVLPALLAMLAGGLLYWRTMVPLRLLQARVRRFQDDPEARVGPGLAARRDEFGDLGRRFDRMAERVAQVLGSQRQLLHDMSHELRTPLSRLSVALEGDLSEQDLRRRVAREVTAMRELVSDTLSLAWHDTEQRGTATEPLSPLAVWDLVVDNAAFESGWPAAAFRAGCPPTPASPATSTIWPRRWKIWCATRCAIRRRRARSAWTAAAKATAGTCGSATGAPVSPTTGWTASSSLSCAWTRRAPPAAASAWGSASPAARCTARAAGSGRRTATPACACTCACPPPRKFPPRTYSL
ncbi:histidine kinase sensor domain-containing protein [Alloalcanivorax venustensis]|uniref:histidine kinase sensor domain-containing protein n=1 Tax=Alloalcanivorax venustensis TaxID=172371 RepID=UPI003C501479